MYWYELLCRNWAFEAFVSCWVLSIFPLFAVLQNQTTLSNFQNYEKGQIQAKKGLVNVIWIQSTSIWSPFVFFFTKPEALVGQSKYWVSTIPMNSGDFEWIHRSPKQNPCFKTRFNYHKSWRWTLISISPISNSSHSFGIRKKINPLLNSEVSPSHSIAILTVCFGKYC